jgi:hypothetical protein
MQLQILPLGLGVLLGISILQSPADGRDEVALIALPLIFVWEAIWVSMLVLLLIILNQEIVVEVAYLALARLRVTPRLWYQTETISLLPRFSDHATADLHAQRTLLRWEYMAVDV